MENKKAVIIAAVIALVVAVVIVGAIIFLTSLLRGRVSRPIVLTSSPTPVTSNSTTNALPSTGQLAPTPPSTTVANVKIVSVGGYTMSYPNNWGILKCSNSQSLEFDSYNSTDQLSVVCDYAVKPITILVTGNLNCPGETVTLGGNKAIRSKTASVDGVDYRWCVIGSENTYLDITHRVSSSGGRATSKDDVSAQIEQMISTIRTGGAS